MKNLCVIFSFSDCCYIVSRVHFQSDNSISAAHDDYLTSISQDHYAHSRTRHPFIIQFPPGCGASCHEAVKSKLSDSSETPGQRHYVLTSSYAQVITTSHEMNSIKSQLSDVVVDYAAMLPSLKVEHMTHVFSQNDLECDGKNVHNVNNKVELQVVLASLEESELTSAMSLLQKVIDDFYSNAGQVSLAVDPRGLSPNAENTISFDINCIKNGNANRISSSTISKIILEIANLPFVLWVERREVMKPHNRWATGLCQSGNIEEHPIFDSGLDGDGIVVGVSDTGIDMTHCQFYDVNVSTPYNTIDHSHRKVVMYDTFADDTDDSSGHGTHVSSTVAGKSNIRYGDFMKYDGNALEAKLAFFDIGNSFTESLVTPSNLNSGLLQPLRNAGGKISSHSWGSSSSAYTTDARNIDSFMWTYADSLVLYAAGNDGESEGVGSVGSPSTNKNGLCVGASINSYDVMRAVMGPDIDADLYSDDSMAGFSSIGPTGDGRLKPDLAAPGWYTVAAEAISGAGNDHCDVQILRGTSMATPTVAGNAALIQQYFVDGFYPSGSKNAADVFTPSGALLKAMLIHSGVSMDTVTYDDGTQDSTGGYPSTIQGYGKIRLSNVLNFGESTSNPLSLFVKGDTDASSPLYASITSTGTVDRFYIIASSPASPIRVTMTYTDPAGSPGSSKPIVNDLELRVRRNGDVYVPYYNSFSDINNVEMIDIPNPCAGCNYTIEVRAVTLNLSPQPYAVVATGIITEGISNSSRLTTDINSDESIGPLTLRIIIALGLTCLFLGSIVIYLHKCDVPPQTRRRHKSFAEEQREQAEALRYYEEQQRQRNRRAPPDDSTVGERRVERDPDAPRSRKKKKGRNRETEMVRRQERDNARI